MENSESKGDHTYTTLAGDNTTYGCRRIHSVRIGWAQASSLCNASGASPHVHIVSLNGVAILITVEVGHHAQRRVLKVILFDKYLRTHSTVDARGWVVLVAVTVDVANTKADARQARVDVRERVVVICNVKLCGNHQPNAWNK